MAQFKSIETITLSEVVRKPTNFILKNFLPIPQGTVSCVASEGGLGKTFLSLTIASKFVTETDKRALCWFSEDSKEIIGYRFDKLKKSGDVEEHTQNKIEYVLTEPMQFAKLERGAFRANYEALADIRKDCILNDVGLVVIDPLLAFYGGNENDNSQARIFMQPFLAWAKQDNVNIIFVHHANKGEGKTRGAGAFRDAFRTLYEMRYITDDDGNIDFNLKDRGIRKVVLAKDNLGAFMPFNELYGAGVTDMQVIPPLAPKVEVVEYDTLEMPNV